MRKPVSITLRPENLLWLKGQAAVTDKGSVSEVVDSLVSEARLKGRSAAAISVVGTIDLPEDADLEWTGPYMRRLVEQSIKRPLLVRERPPRSRRRRG